jgi:hypothetical protein
MVGGALPPGFVTWKVSVRHWVAVDTGIAPAARLDGCPFSSMATTLVLVDGPVMENVLKSKRSWHILSLQGHIFMRQLPLAVLVDEK